MRSPHAKSFTLLHASPRCAHRVRAEPNRHLFLLSLLQHAPLLLPLQLLRAPDIGAVSPTQTPLQNHPHRGDILTGVRSGGLRTPQLVVGIGRIFLSEFCSDRMQLSITGGRKEFELRRNFVRARRGKKRKDLRSCEWESLVLTFAADDNIAAREKDKQRHMVDLSYEPKVVNVAVWFPSYSARRPSKTRRAATLLHTPFPCPHILPPLKKIAGLESFSTAKLIVFEIACGGPPRRADVWWSSSCRRVVY